MSSWEKHHVVEGECCTSVWAEGIEGAVIHTLKVCVQCGGSADCCVRVDGNGQGRLEEARLMPSARDVPQDQAAMRNWRNPGACFWRTEGSQPQELHQD